MLLIIVHASSSSRYNLSHIYFLQSICVILRFYHNLLVIRGKNEELRKWIEENKYELGYIENLNSREQLLEAYEKHGILTEYLEMYSRIYEEKCGDIIFSDERTPINTRDDDPWSMADNLDEYNSIFGENDYE